MSAPVKYTCPKIDEVIKDIKSALSSVEVLRDTLYEYLNRDLQDEITNAISLLEPLSENNSRNLIEDLRDNNSDLRRWGEDLEDKLGEAESKIDELRSKLLELI